MESGDGWLVRVRVPGGSISSRQLRAVADASVSAGTGLIEITSRANLQLRGCRNDALAGLADTLIAAGLSSGDALIDRTTAVVDSPFAPADRWTSFSNAILAGASSQSGGPGLPAKFSVVVDLDPQWLLHDLDADATVRVGGVMLRRRVGRIPTDGSMTEARRIVESLAAWCARTGKRTDQLVDTDARHTLNVEPVTTDLPPPPSLLLGSLGSERAVLAAPLLGRSDARVFHRVADIADEHGAAIRLTNQRSIALVHDRTGTVSPGLLGEMRTLDWSVDPGDPLARISACVGLMGCTSGHIDTAEAARSLAPANDCRLHVSACDKGCGAPRGVRHLVADPHGILRTADQVTQDTKAKT